MKVALSFHRPLYKDQTVAADEGKIIEAGDTVALVIENSTSSPTLQNVTVTKVTEQGKRIEWDLLTTGNLFPDKVIRHHHKHTFRSKGRLNYAIVLTESSASSVKAKVTSMEFGGAPYAIDIEETTLGNGITTEFRDRLLAKINEVLLTEGYAASGVIAGSAGSQTLTVTINGLNLTPGAVVVAGLTASSWYTVGG